MSRTVLMALLATAVVLTGCGDDGAQEPDVTPPPTPAATAAAPTEDTEAQATEAAEPAERTYRVRRGDTLSSIAQRFDTTVRALVRLNNIDDPNHIRAGQELKVPGGG